MPFEQMPQAVPSKPKQEEEHVPGAGERLAQDFLIHRETKDPETLEALTRFVNRVRDEYVENSRDAKGIPETAVLTDYILGRMPMILQKYGDQPAEVYQGVTEELSNRVDQVRKKPPTEKAN